MRKKLPEYKRTTRTWKVGSNYYGDVNTGDKSVHEFKDADGKLESVTIPETHKLSEARAVQKVLNLIFLGEECK